MNKNSKFFKKATTAMVAGVLCASMAVGATACGGDGGNGGGRKYNEDSTPLIFSSGEFDGVFNPYFSTSAYDSDVVGQTQIGMLSVDEQGKTVYGKDEPCMTLDLTQKMYDANNQETQEGTEATKTVYEFLIKNGVKDSTGAPLTIKDVLFNLYVYLDPMYNGSSTMYSTKIKGLKEYRTGGMDEDQLNNTLNSNINAMMLTLVEYAKYKNGDDKHNYPDQGNAVQEAVQEAYIQKLYGFIDEMAAEDWTSAKGGVKDANNSYILVDNKEYITNKIDPRTYDITHPWQVFLINEGMCQFVKVNDNSKTEETKDPNTQETIPPRFYVLLDSGLESDITAAIEGKTEAESLAIQEQKCKEAMASFKTYSQVESMLFGSSVYDKMFDYFHDIALEELMKDLQTAPNVSGITTRKLQAGATFNNTAYAMEHDVLTIEIEKVDPKAIFNFSFTVAPMRYYSNSEQINLFDGEEHFGIEKGDTNFRDTVLKNSAKIGLPQGAGCYMASSATGGAAASAGDFKSNNVVYFERNPYFYTLGLDSATATQADLEKGNDNTASIHNAYVKYIRYQVVNSAAVMDAMIAGQIDYSTEIAAKRTNIASLNSYKQSGELDYVRQENSGYGYVGVNPKYVPDIEVRRLIMLAMDRDIITNNYYTDGLGSIIERSMSKSSWAYPDPEPEAYYTPESINALYQKNYKKSLNLAKYDFEGDGMREFISDALKEILGYSMDGDCLSKKLADGKKYKLDYTFTIAGDTKDHPAYAMFSSARDDLNYAGMKIKVKNDVQALSKLSNGSLAVWAAAWSSAVDPDMYQVYHKNSQATSVNNWGYNVILSDSKGLYTTEQGIITKLSKTIDAGRAYLDEATRAEQYAIALDQVMELAVELPTYQRVNLLTYNSKKIDKSSLNTDNITAYSGLIDELWNLRLR